MSGNGCTSDFAVTVGKLKSRVNSTAILQVRAERTSSRICLNNSRIQLHHREITDYFFRLTFGTWMILRPTSYFSQWISSLFLNSQLLSHHLDYHHSSFCSSHFIHSA